MPRLPTIFDDTFISSLEDFFTKTAQVAPAQTIDPANIQLALDMVNRLSGLPGGEIAPGSSVSRPGGVSAESQPGVSDLYSLDAFIQYLMKQNFQHGGSPGGAGLSIVAPAEGVKLAEGSPYSTYTSKAPPGEYLVNKDGLIATLKEVGKEAAASKNMYLQELTTKLMDDVVSSGQFNLPENAFAEQKAKLDPAPAAKVQTPAKQNPAPGQANQSPNQQANPQNRSPNQNGAVPVSMQVSEGGDAALTGHGIPSIWDWMPFWGNGTINFADIDNFITKLDELIQNYGNDVGLSRYQWLSRVQAADEKIHGLENEFNQTATPTMRSMKGIQYDLGRGPIDAANDFKQQFDRVGENTLENQIRTATVMEQVVLNVRYLLQILTQAPGLYGRVSGFKEMVDAQINEAHTLESKLQQLSEMIQNELQNLPKTNENR